MLYLLYEVFGREIWVSVRIWLGGICFLQRRDDDGSVIDLNIWGLRSEWIIRLTSSVM